MPCVREAGTQLAMRECSLACRGDVNSLCIVLSVMCLATFIKTLHDDRPRYPPSRSVCCRRLRRMRMMESTHIHSVHIIQDMLNRLHGELALRPTADVCVGTLAPHIQPTTAARVFLNLHSLRSRRSSNSKTSASHDLYLKQRETCTIDQFASPNDCRLGLANPGGGS